MYGGPSAGGYGGGSYGTNRAAVVVGSEKMEEDLASSIRKALSTEETAPKQKHVRSIILYTWDMKSAGSFWRAMKTFPALSDEIVLFKMLITMHKVIRQGHPMVIKEGVRERNFVVSLSRTVSYSGGYADLIRAYVQFLDTKLEYHGLHPEFLGNFDYEEYVSLKGIADPNEGYSTIEELLEMLGRIETLQKLIFQSLRPTSNNEARIAALVPLVEESYGIYEFLVSMLTAMHQVIGSVEILSPLRSSFNKAHHNLRRFYDDCRSLRYLTSLISIPNLLQDAPDFLAKGPPTRQPKVASLEKEQQDDEEEKFREEQDRLHQQLLLEQAQQEQRQRELEQERRRQLELERQRMEQQMAEQQRQQQLERQRLEEERLRQMSQVQAQNAQMEIQMYQTRLMEAQAHKEQLMQQAAQDRNTIEQYMNRMRLLEDQVNLLNSRNDQETVLKLSGEVNVWKQKYEALAKVYAQLRKEHMDLLQQYKTLKDAGSTVSDQAKAEMEKLRAEMRAKANETTELLIERDRYKNEAERLKNQFADDAAALRRELRDAKESLTDLSRSKGSEMSAIVSRFNAEKAQLEASLSAKDTDLEILRKRLEEATENARRAESNHAQELGVLQAGLDQALLAFAEHQKNANNVSTELSGRMERLRLDHMSDLIRMLDRILSGCAQNIDDIVYQLDSPSYSGNQGASPEFVLSVLEKVHGSCSDFANAMVRVSAGGDPNDAIAPSNAFVQSIVQLCHNVKGVNRLAGDDSVADEMIKSMKKGALDSKQVFIGTQSTSLAHLPIHEKADAIVRLCSSTQGSLASIGTLVEKLAPKDVSSLTNVEADIGDVVEREMKNVAKAIEDAARRLEGIVSKPRAGPNLQVHSAILEAAMAITNAIGNLIKCATATEQEIVAQGRGSTSKGAFYKKNNKWTEGLISAAKSVAVATTYLVEVADGLIQGTHTWEQLVVAAQEVSVATTQLVAASRVKSVPFSKTQDKLEAAAVSVREATSLLVKAAKAASQQSSEQRAEDEIRSLGRHEFKVKEMEQQVRILEIEKELQTARYKLAGIRKSGYHPE